MVGRRRDQCDTRNGVTQPSNEVVYLTTGQLSALTRLSALCHFDLQHFGIYQIVRRNTEPARSDLLNLRYPIRTIACRVFATFATVGACTDRVHSHCQSFVSLGGKCTERHACRVESFQDRVNGLDIFEWNRLRAWFEIK